MNSPVEDAIPFQQVKKVLVVKLRQLGDVLLTTPVFSVLKRLYPHLRLDALVYRESIALLKGHPAVDTIHAVDRGWKRLSVLERIRCETGLMRTLRKTGYDVIINLTEGDRGAIAALFSGARWRVGRKEEMNKGFLGKPRVYTHLYRAQDRQRHMVEQHLDALRRIGLQIPLNSEPLVLNIPDTARRSAREKMRAAGWDGERYILLNPTSRCPYKCLPEPTVARVGEGLHRAGWRLAIASGPAEAEIRMIRNIVDQTDVPMLDLGGTLDLMEFGAALEYADASVGSDSLPMHMAAALRVPSATWFGPSMNAVWHPWLVPHRAIAMDLSCRPCHYQGCGDGMVSECLTGMDADTIVEAVLDLVG
jgi:heptosyltransferase-3